MSEKYSRKEISDMQQKEGWNVKMQVKYKYLRWNTWVNVLSYSPPLCLPEVRAASSSSSSSGLMTAATSRSGRSQWNLERADGLNRHVSSQDRLCYFITVLSYIHLTALVTCYFSEYNFFIPFLTSENHLSPNSVSPNHTFSYESWSMKPWLARKYCYKAGNGLFFLWEGDFREFYSSWRTATQQHVVIL